MVLLTGPGEILPEKFLARDYLPDYFDNFIFHKKQAKYHQKNKVSITIVENGAIAAIKYQQREKTMKVIL
jgi:ssRNA-specific RNase YbeY (16S rRNA maturation enzyme)